VPCNKAQPEDAKPSSHGTLPVKAPAPRLDGAQQATSSAIPLGDVHPRLELPDLDAGGDVGTPQRGIAPHDVKQAPADLAPQSLRSAGREDDGGVHEASAVGTDVIRVTPYGAALDPVGLEALRITERVVEPVEEMGEAGGVAEIARVL